ncbi:NADPH:quinone oxidoreductase family protein [Sneathiella chinensis]|uniref:NADPH:quinone oxidoreductase n=1 Tax=Sneathiella chinensis TaxID=349750 RepID=A0ABQ5U486_9PROT|nr:NADPH:quinone oxidoreductase family protein [Sneathiella chinensis]GLQ06048.1 NADPH:quinone oxidoreductase [Sneathiella chinensis]
MNRSAVCSSLEGPDRIRIEEQSPGLLAAGAVRIAVRAAALNFPDLLMTYGKYQYRPPLPFVPGMEGAGVIQDLGAGVQGFRVGDRVLFRGKTGALASLADVPVDHVSALPERLSFEEGAAFGVTFSTAYIALARRGQLAPGERVLVLGAGGGVGQASVAVGAALGGHVIAAASTTEKLDIARQSGAGDCINYRQDDLRQSVAALTDGEGVDMVLDPVGGRLLEDSLYCLRPGGRLLTVGFASGSFGNLPLADLQAREISLLGVRAGEYGRRNPDAGKTAQRELFELADRKVLRPYVGKIWDLVQVTQALKAMELGKVLGKQVVRIDC